MLLEGTSIIATGGNSDIGKAIVLAARQFIAQGGSGLILTISSTHEGWSMPGNIAYCVSKGYVNAITVTIDGGLPQSSEGL